MSFFRINVPADVSRISRLSARFSSCVRNEGALKQFEKNFESNPDAVTQDLATQRILSRYARSPSLKTLKPERMLEVDQKVYPLSNTIYFQTLLEERGSFHFKMNREQPLLLTQRTGVFYYYQDPRLPELAGEVRFRLCDDPADFDKGQDYLSSLNQPWSIKLHCLAHYDRYEAIRQQLVREGLVSEDLLDDLKRFKVVKGIRWIFRLDQPFSLKLEQMRIKCAFATRHTVTLLPLEGVYKDFRRASRQRCVVPFSGVIRVRLELSTLPQHERQGPTLVMRITELVTPLRSLIEGYDNYIPIPEVGTLVSRNLRNRRYEPWSFPLETRGTGRDIKEFIRLTSPDILI